eukprot:9514840-Ditylum_brightwellii.AAC.1
MTRRPWRGKQTLTSHHKNKPALHAGQCILVDQMESTTLGFVAQLKGRLTIKRYQAATIFVDHYSRFTYVHLQCDLSSKQTLEAKRTFEIWSANVGVKIEHYHADNGWFAHKAFMQDYERNGQMLTVCATKSHWQNGITGKRSRDLKESARRQLLHAQSRLPDKIITIFWPYPLRTVAESGNTIPDKEDASCPLSRFSNLPVQARLKNKHPFRCPVFAL